MKVTEPEVSQQYTALYQATVQHAVGGAAALMARLVAHTRAVLRGREDQATDRRERDRLMDSRRQLNQFEPALCARFSEELLSAFARVSSTERALPAASPDLHFDQLADMDESQLRQNVEAARVQHASNAELSELNRLICAMLGQPVLQLERYPLRPAVYVDAVTAVLTHLPAPPIARLGWITIMTGALAQELDVHYRDLCARLRPRGVGSAAPAVVGRPPGPGPGEADAAHPANDQKRAVLTLEQLRRLLADEPLDPDGAAVQRYERGPPTVQGDSALDALDAVPTGFRPTVPAAFDAALEMKRVDQVVRRLEQRAGAAPTEPDPTQALRSRLRRGAHGLEQTLGLEVVAMMVDNITHDPRLLGPVQRIVAELEPALLQLALVDPRFFSHKQHPARRLLHEITHRSIAFESVASRGFSGFMEPLREAMAPLSAGVIDTAEPFDKALGQLVGAWDDPAGRDKRQLAKAVRALQKAEQRRALAATIVQEVVARPDVAAVPDAVIDFLCGPWAQVMAHARIVDKSGADDPGGYGRTIDDLMWSAQPELSRKDVSALTRLVPQLLGRLREGLATIGYPPLKTSAFFEVLMNLHQRGFKPDPGVAPPPAGDQPRAAASTAARLGGPDVWVGPLEAQASGFIDLTTEQQPLAPPAPADALQVGIWVALMAEGGWTRTRLAWTSPNATLLLFSDALGYLQSLTRTAYEQLFAAGQLRIISADPVEDALDAVAQAAMRNSVDIRF